MYDRREEAKNHRNYAVTKFLPIARRTFSQVRQM
jgi:hypothetical protein